MDKKLLLKRMAVGLTVVCTAMMVAVGGTAAEGSGETNQPGLQSEQQVHFSDIDKHWAKSAIESAVKKSYVSGYTDGTFLPNKLVTRAEFASMLVGALGLELPIKNADEKWYIPATQAAIHAGITSFEEFKGNWSTLMTREEMARFAVRATGEPNTDPKKWMYLVTLAGIMSGVGNGELAADKSTTRAEAVVVIEKTLQVKNGETLKADKHAVSQAEILWHKTNIFSMMPQFFSNGKVLVEWDPNNLFVQTKDDMYRSELEALIAIDLEDPKDPNRGLLPDGLLWYTFSDLGGLPIKDYKDSYVLYFKGKTVFNKNKSRYGDYFFFGMAGNDPNVKPGKDSRNIFLPVYRKTTADFPAVIVPKKGYRTSGNIRIILETPTRSSEYAISKDILHVTVPKIIE